MRFKITIEEIMFALFIAFLGFIFSLREFIIFLDTLNPIQGLLLYYLILYSCLLLLSKLGLVIYKFELRNPLQILGALLITFAFFIIVGWESQYIQIVTNRSIDEKAISNVYFQCEDGATWWFWQNVMKVSDVEHLRLLTYVITPFVLSLVGVALISKIKF